MIEVLLEKVYDQNNSLFRMMGIMDEKLNTLLTPPPEPTIGEMWKGNPGQ
jgi:hypothetical protein